MADWVTISSLATAGGTLALACATYAATRSSNRSARIAEQALQEQRRPLLVSARLDDPEQKAMFSDRHWVNTSGSQAVVEEQEGALYLAIPVRNVGAGIAVVQGWHLWPELATSGVAHREPEEFRRQIRDIYVAPGDLALWQAALREADAGLEHQFAALRAQREVFTIDLLYRDQVGEQRSISRFTISPVGDDAWLANV